LIVATAREFRKTRIVWSRRLLWGVAFLPAAAVRRTIAGESPAKGGILSALRRSPLAGAELNLKRPAAPDRKVDL
jgi:hypothetical protein